MSREITMPQLGFTMVEGTVAEWRKREGDAVARGEVLMEVTTEKVSIEVESQVAGVLERILVPAGATVPVGAPVCLIVADDEEPARVASGSAASSQAANAVQSVSAGHRPSPELSMASDEPRVRASGVAKRLAREKGIDLAALNLRGSGPGGRILESDVLAYLQVHADAGTRGHGNAGKDANLPLPLGEGPGEAPGLSPTGPRTLKGAATDSVQRLPVASPQSPVPHRLPFASTRRLTAERMFQSARETAHVTLVAEVDATEAVKLREQLLPEWEKSDGVRLSFNDMIVKACGKALREHPTLNASLQGEEILLWEEVNVGIAVALEDALIVPVLREADSKPLRTIASESRQLVDRARQKKLAVDEVSGGTFTITNLGSYGIDLFTPIINPPETAILGVGRIAERPAVYQGEICKRSLMYLSLTFDHRLVDGAPAALFLARIRELLERPYLLLA